MKTNMAAFLILFSLFAVPSAFTAYSDEIVASPKEIWRAVESAMKSHGIYKSNFEKKTIESKWVEDRVVRYGKFKTSANYLRRYRFKVEVEETAFNTIVTVKGSFHQKPWNSAPGLPWEPVQPKGEDLDLERTFFMKILGELEKIRKETSRI